MSSKTAKWVKRNANHAHCYRCGAQSQYVNGLQFEENQPIIYWRWWSEFKRWHKNKCIPRTDFEEKEY